MTISNADNTENQKLNGLSDIENGPITEANRECRDIFCTVLFFAVLVGMVYLSAYGYSNGSPTKVFRATDSNGNVCGDPNGVAANYPYAYFYNPTSLDLSNRFCVQECPYFSSGSLTTLSCYGQTCNYAVTITSTGTYTTNPASTSVIIGYETSSLIDRVCIPSTTVFNGVFSSYITVFSNYLNQSDLASFITDLQNVN
jgi:hypothetical protein